jgi:cystathionine beta-lyase
MLYPHLKRPNRDYGGRLIRLNIGLEEPQDLIEDLKGALQQLNRR